MAIPRTVRIYDLAKELKLETKRVIEELRRGGADVSVPSNSVPIELADKLRRKHLSRNEAEAKRAVKVFRKDKSSFETKTTEARLVKHFYGEELDSAEPFAHHIVLPARWKFTSYGKFNFNNFLRCFDWSLKDENVKIDFRHCCDSNYQAVSLLILYMWHLKKNSCRVEIIYGTEGQQSLTTMWWNMNAEGWLHVLNSATDNFDFVSHKHLFAVRPGDADLKTALQAADRYTENFDIEYKTTLRYIISEILINAQEHGTTREQIPALLQFSWYSKKKELSFIIADVGIGVKKHLSQTYPHLASDVEAIELALQPEVSGTFANQANPYKEKNNFGYGLYISSSLLQQLRADVHMVSGNGLVHISPSGKNRKTLDSSWNGTFVYVTVKLGAVMNLEPTQKMIKDANEAAVEMLRAESNKRIEAFDFHVRNYFGSDAVDKSLAIRLRDQKLLPALDEGKTLIINFEGVAFAPHSLLNALLATPVKRLGMHSFKRIKINNAAPEIRQITDFIFDENTSLD
jgi:hypothetical protein